MEATTNCNECRKQLVIYTKPSHSEFARFDAYGIFTGIYCDECYTDPAKYPFKKDEYFDESFAGEVL